MLGRYLQEISTFKPGVYGVHKSFNSLDCLHCWNVIFFEIFAVATEYGFSETSLSTSLPQFYQFSLYNNVGINANNNNKNKHYQNIKQNYSIKNSYSKNKIHHHEHHLGPFFEGPLNARSENKTAHNITTKVHLFTEAVLNCRVGMLRDKTVRFYNNPNNLNKLRINSKNISNIIFNK